MLFHGDRLAGVREKLLLHDAPDRLPMAYREHVPLEHGVRLHQRSDDLPGRQPGGLQLVVVPIIQD